MQEQQRLEAYRDENRRKEAEQRRQQQAQNSNPYEFSGQAKPISFDNVGAHGDDNIHEGGEKDFADIEQ